MTIATLFNAGALALIGRDPRGLADEYAMTDDKTAELLIAEYRAMENFVRQRSQAKAATNARNIAVELIPAVATTCNTETAVDLMLDAVTAWLEGMGSIPAYARNAAQNRQTGNPEDTGMILPISDVCDAVFDVYDANSLAVTLHFYDAKNVQGLINMAANQPVIVGMHYIDQEDGEREGAAVPELTA